MTTAKRVGVRLLAPETCRKKGAGADSRRASIPLLVALILLGALIVRLIPVGRYVTPDEPAWVHRSVLFADAIAARDWAAVPSTGHPGVTTMWLGALGIGARRALDPVVSAQYLDWIRRMAWLSPDNGEGFRRLAYFLPYGRLAVTATTIVGLAVIYRLARRLWGAASGAVALGLLAFDGFLVGLSGLLHTDALLATFLTIAVFALLVSIRAIPGGTGWALASGVAGGLALATKSLAVALLPYTFAALGVLWLSGRARFGDALRRGALWTAAVVVTFWALYPAMWRAPLGTVRDLLAAPKYQSTIALTPTFFAGKTALAHGPEFYAVALLFRMSPVTLLGLALGLLSLRGRRERPFGVASVLLFCAGYVLLLMLSPKKFDRYLLPVLVLLSVLGGAGILAYPFRDRSASRRRNGAAAVGGRALAPRLAVAIVAQAVLLVPFAGYPLTSFNLALGGPWTARSLLPTDWGEGMGASATWLNGLPGANRLTIAAASVPSFASLFAGKTVPLDGSSLADYAVTSREALPGAAPVHTAHRGLLPGPTIYENAEAEAQRRYLARSAAADDLIIVDADTPVSRHYDGPGLLIDASKHADASNLAERISQVAPETATVWWVHDLKASAITSAMVRRTLGSASSPAATAQVGSATVVRYELVGPIQARAPATFYSFGDTLSLVGAQLPPGPVRGAFPVSLRWQASRPADVPLYATVLLRDQDLQTWTEVGQPVVNATTFPATDWLPGEWVDAEMAVAVPPLLAPGPYSLSLTLTDSRGAQLGAWDASGAFRGIRPTLGQINVAEPPTAAGVQPCDGPSFCEADALRACIFGPAPSTILSGDSFSIDVTWSARQAPSVDHAVRLTLVDTDGDAVSEERFELSPHPTSEWRSGDSYMARYTMPTDPTLPPGSYRVLLAASAPAGTVEQRCGAQLGTIEIVGRDRSYELPDGIEHPLAVQFGPDIRLRGFDLDVEAGGAADLHAGDTVLVRLYWHAHAPTDTSYTLSVQLLGPDGRPHGQVDRIPGSGASPTSSWAPGQVIVDEVAVALDEDPPAGAYAIAVGLYDVDSGRRLAVTSEDGQAAGQGDILLPISLSVAPNQ